jgi:hypothetical protein
MAIPADPDACAAESRIRNFERKLNPLPRHGPETGDQNTTAIQNGGGANCSENATFAAPISHTDIKILPARQRTRET